MRGARIGVAIAACALLLACSNAKPRDPFVTDSAWPRQNVTLSLNTSGKGELILSIFPFPDSIPIDPSLLSFSWDEGARAYAHLVDLHKIEDYGSAGSETYHYAATVFFESFPSKIGVHVLHIRPLPSFAPTTTGPIDVKPISIFMWRPDELGIDRGQQVSRSRYLGRTIYAYGGARVGCHYDDTVYDWHSGLRVTSVKRETSRIDLLVTGTTLSALPGGSAAFSFFAIHPLKLELVPVPGTKPLGKNGPSLQGDREIPCHPGMRFGDPWHAETTITTSAPPRRIEKIHLGSRRIDVLWLNGYPNVYGTAEQFERMNTWSYHLPAPSAWYVQFRNDRVVKYKQPIWTI
jgi:hypothetical protein